MDTGNREGIGQIWLLQSLVLDGLLWIIFLTTTILCHLVRFITQFNHTFIYLINEGSRAYFFLQILPPSMHKSHPPRLLISCKISSSTWILFNKIQLTRNNFSPQQMFHPPESFFMSKKPSCSRKCESKYKSVMFSPWNSLFVKNINYKT